MRIMLFLGSGVSIRSGVPCTRQITESILVDEWHNTTVDVVYLPGVSAMRKASRSNHVPVLQRFLKILKAHSDKYNAIKELPDANYEDLYYLADQICSEELEKTFNAAIAPFIQQIRSETNDLVPQLKEAGATLGTISKHSCDLIRCAVWNLLKVRPPIGLDLVAELAATKDIEKLDIFTSNHDYQLETFFVERNIDFTDGLGSPDGGIRFFDSQLFDQPLKTRLFKIHGSIRLFRFAAAGVVKFGMHAPGTSLYAAETAASVRWRNIDGVPVFLTGTYNKIPMYKGPIFGEMYRRFLDALQEHDKMIMSGYGWGDEGVNSALIDWLESRTPNRLILLHQNPAEIKTNYKTDLCLKFDYFVRNKRIVVIQKWLESTTLKEIMRVL